MNDLHEFVNRYLAVWNESNPEKRRTSIEQLWSKNVIHYTPTRAVHGYTAMEQRITTNYDQYVGEGRYKFQPSTYLEGHHNAIKFNWVMVPYNDCHAVAAGSTFVLLNENDQIDRLPLYGRNIAAK